METLKDNIWDTIPGVINALNTEALGGSVPACKTLLDAAMSMTTVQADDTVASQAENRGKAGIVRHYLHWYG